MIKKERADKAKKTAKIIAVWIGLIAAIALGLVFLFFSPIGKKITLPQIFPFQQTTQQAPVKAPILKAPLNRAPVRAPASVDGVPAPIPLHSVESTSPQDIIKATTTIADAVMAILQKVFGFITSGLGAFFLIKKVKDEKKPKKA